MTKLFCAGLGYTARVIANRLASQGWSITGTSTNSAGADAIAALGHAALVFDGTSSVRSIAAALNDATHLLVSAPPGPDGDPLLRQHCADISGAAGLGWIGYLSTVGVYGDRQGGWVDETSLPLPCSPRSKSRLAAEQQWLRLGESSGIAVDVFRLAGIYGAGRSAIDNLKSGTARRVIKPGQVFNRIHVEDIATVVCSAMRRPSERRIFNVADDEPAPPQDVLAFAADLLGLPLPPAVAFEAAGLSPMAASFYAENKRVCNAQISRELGVKLAYPTYREGLSALVSEP